MNLKIKFNTVIQSVLLAALIGIAGNCYAEPNDTPNVDSSKLQEITQKAKKEVKTDNTTTITSDQIEELEESIKDLKKDIKKARRGNRFTFILLLAVAGAGFYFYRKMQSDQEQLRKEQKQQLKDFANKFNNSLLDASKNIEKKVNEIRDDNSRAQQQTRQQQTHQQPSRSSEVTQRPQTSQSTQQTSQSPKETVKYFMLTEQGGKSFARERNLKDEPISWFCMKINGNKASYDINRKVLNDILSDIATLQMCTKEFEMKQNARDIVTVRPGTMEKVGSDWVVIDKLTIKLA